MTTRHNRELIRYFKVKTIVIIKITDFKRPQRGRIFIENEIKYQYIKKDYIGVTSISLQAF